MPRIVLLWALIAVPLGGYCVAHADEPKTADDVIARYIEALGGRDKLAARQSLRLTGKVTMPGDMEARFTQESKRSGKFRLELTLPQSPGMVVACDGQRWWQIMPMVGKTDPEEMSPELARVAGEQGDTDGPLVDYAKKGHKVEWGGRTELDGQPAYKLHVVLKGAAEGEFDDYYIDGKSFLVMKIKGRRTIQGVEAEYEKTAGDYKPVGGLLVAHLSRQQAGDMVYTNLVEKAESNIELPDERFKMPAAQPKEPASQPTSAPAIRNDPAARALYDQMIAALRAADSLSYESKYQLSVGAMPNPGCSYKIWLKKPNYFRLEAFRFGGALAGVLIGDGENLWIYWQGERPFFSSETQAAYELTKSNVYMTKPTPLARHSIGHEVGLLGNGIIMTILDPSTFHGYTDSLQPLIDAVARRDAEPVAGEPCDVIDVSFMDGQRTWRLWISQRDHLPRKLKEAVHVATDINVQEDWSDVTINADIPNERFIWKPPDGWKEWRLPQSEQLLLKPGETAPDFELTLADGKTTKLADYRGKVLWLVFWRVG